MDHIASIKQLIEKHLPKNHLTAILVLSALSIILLFPAPSNESLTTPTIIDNGVTSNTPQVLPATELKSTQPTTITTSPQKVEVDNFIENKDPRFITQVQSGDNLSVIFDRAGLTPRDVYAISNSGPEAKILSNLYPGYTLAFDISDSGQLKELEVIKTSLESYLFSLNNQDKFKIEHILRSPDIKHSFKEAEIQDSLFMAAQKGGISAPITMEIAGIFGGVIDFMLDTRTGDTFNVLYEEEYLGEEFIGDGTIQVAQFINQGEKFTALRYVNTQGEVGYFNPEGESMRKAFLRNPLDFTRISSGFNPSRKHPILNTIRAHKGTDYAAPRGTEIVATGDGRITWAARNGSFGKLVVIQHGDQFETKYAHLSSYASGVKKGARVRQGQIIGYVGTTGSATGPHLHYEFLMNGVHRNSRTIHNRLPKAESINPDEMQRFRQQTQILLSRLESYTETSPNLAQNIQ